MMDFDYTECNSKEIESLEPYILEINRIISDIREISCLTDTMYVCEINDDGYSYLQYTYDVPNPLNQPLFPIYYDFLNYEYKSVTNNLFFGDSLGNNYEGTIYDYKMMVIVIKYNQMFAQTLYVDDYTSQYVDGVYKERPLDKCQVNLYFDADTYIGITGEGFIIDIHNS